MKEASTWARQAHHERISRLVSLPKGTAAGSTVASVPTLEVEVVKERLANSIQH